MADDLASEETSFVSDEVSAIVKEAIDNVLGTASYHHNKLNQWTSSIVEQCLNQFTKLDKPFKYIVNCVIMQRTGAGYHTAISCYWDSNTDGTCTVNWGDSNKTMHCVVTVFGMAM